MSRQQKARAYRKRVCLDKVAHPTEDAAYGALRSFQRRFPDYRGRVYRCEFANHFHVGTPPRQERQRIAATRRNRQWDTTLGGA